MKTLTKYFLILLVVGNFSIIISAQVDTSIINEPPKTVLTEKQENLSDILKARRIETFNIVWKTINENYFDRTFSGLDWNKIRTEYEIKAKNAKTDVELHIILQEMISKLGKSHFSIIPPEVYIEFQRKKDEAKLKFENKDGDEEFEQENDNENIEAELDNSLHRYGIGVELRLIDDKFVITKIDKNSTAQKAGLKIGYILEKVNGVSLDDFVVEISQYIGKKESFKNKIAFLLVDEILNGEKDSMVEISVLNGLNNLEEFSLKREKIEGEFVKLVSNVPESYFRYESRSIDENIGYIKFNYFVMPLVNKFCNSITEFKNKKALIIDLRGNLGGSFGSLMGIAGLLTNKNFNLGTEITRIGEEVRIIKPHLKNFDGNLIILTDELSFSAAEIFSAAFQENGRAKIIGKQTAGEALPAMTKLLPTGAVFLFPVANFKTPKGNFLEGIGVKPDLNVSFNRQILLNGNDNQLSAAVAVINQEIIDKGLQSKKLNTSISTLNKPLQINRLRATKTINKKSIVKKFDLKALQIIEDYLDSIGGRENLSHLKTIVADGKVEIERTGAVLEGTGEIYWASPNKFSEIYRFSSVGEIKEIYDGEKFFIQSEFSSVDDYDSPLMLLDKKLSSNLFELLNAKGFYSQIIYRGSFPLDDKNIELVEAFTAEGLSVAFGFDAKTKLLFKRSSKFSDLAYENYRKVESIMFPFTIIKGGQLKYNFVNVQTNVVIEEEKFIKKLNCFDKVD